MYMKRGLGQVTANWTYIAHVQGYGDFDIGTDFVTLSDATAWGRARFGDDFINVTVEPKNVAETPPYTLPVEIFETSHNTPCVYPRDYVGPLPEGCIYEPAPASSMAWIIGLGLLALLLVGAGAKGKGKF